MELCRDTLWNSSVSWDTHTPRLSSCLQATIEVVAGSLLPLLLLPWLLLLSSTHHGLHLAPRGGRRGLFLVLLRCLTALLILGLTITIQLLHHPQLVVLEVVGTVLICTSALLSCTMEVAMVRARRHTSHLLAVHWLLLLLLLLPQLLGSVGELVQSAPLLPALLPLLRWVAVLLGVALQVPANTAVLPPGVQPQAEASSISLLAFAWLSPLVWRGWRRPLRQEDLPAVDREVEVSRNTRVFLAAAEAQKESQGRIHLWTLLIRCFGKAYLQGMTLFVVRVMLVFCSPLLLQLIIGHVEHSQDPAWHGFLYCAALFTTNSVAVVLDHHGLQRVVVAAIQMRNSCVSAVYRKSLRLSSVARQRFTTGEITNFMSVDGQRLIDSVPFSFFIFVGPLELVVCLVLLYRILGLAVLAGLGVLLLVTPLNLWASKRGETLLENQLKAKDRRIKLMSEILAGIKVLKLYAWELPFMEAINKIRMEEINVLRWIAKLWALVNLTFASVPFLMTLATFLTFVYSDPNNKLTADIIFVSLSLFNLIRTPLTLFPLALMDTIKLFVSVKRINDFLNAEELEEFVAERKSDEGFDPELVVKVEDGAFTWDDREKPTLQGVQLSVRRGELIGIVGAVGAGKSSLLAALLGEMASLGGTVRLVGTRALLAQQPWIQNLSLRDNILFGRVYEAGRYSEAVRVCGLEPDLALMAAGDATEIGENGINLSGGQKQRVALARLVYQQAEVNLLDDPLAALDAEVGRAVFNNVIGGTGVLSGSTRLLVTHNPGVLQFMDTVLVVKEGKVVEQGAYSDLVASGALVGLLAEGSKEVTGKEVVEKKGRDDPLVTRDEDTARLTEDEEALTGEVHWTVYLQYIRAIGVTIFGFNFLMYFICEALAAGANYVLSRWADDPTSNDEMTRTRYLLLYSGLGVLQSGLFFIKELVLFLACAAASKAIHRDLLAKVMHKAMTFFDSNPTGRILNRFSSDIDTVDGTIPFQMDDLMNCVLEVFAILVIIVYTTPYFLLALVPLAILYVLLQKLYIASSRQIKRLDMISKSPIFSHFSESVTGAASVRAFRASERFTTESERLVGANNQCLYLSLSSNRWLGLRLECLGNFVILGASLLAVVGRGSLTPGLAGLSITYSLMVTETLNWLVRMVCALETNAVSLERIFQYSGDGEEAAWETPADREVEEVWPTAGKLDIKNLTVRYRSNLEPVLRDITLELVPGERLGVVGRTGAGKSSLTLALFRVLEAEAGSITLDGQDLSQLGLQKLRSGLTIIPQDPVLFSSSLRFNVDPSSEHSDARVLECLQLAGLGDAARDLDMEVQERGENFSVGQRQLICLARALLRSSKLLVLDEATAAVDPDTDAVVQRTVREEFKGCTVVTIAHRLNTVLDSDRVLVLEAGRVKELGRPADLLADTNSALYSLASHAGITPLIPGADDCDSKKLN